MTVVSFTVPGVPVGKGRARFVRATGHAYTPSKTRAYETLVKVMAKQAMRGRKPFSEACAVFIHVLLTPPQSWSRTKWDFALGGGRWPTGKPDLDNYAKIVVDACNGVVFDDDRQVVKLTATKTYHKSNVVTVEVETIATRMAAG